VRRGVGRASGESGCYYRCECEGLIPILHFLKCGERRGERKEREREREI